MMRVHWTLKLHHFHNCLSILILFCCLCGCSQQSDVDDKLAGPVARIDQAEDGMVAAALLEITPNGGDDSDVEVHATIPVELELSESDVSSSLLTFGLLDEEGEFIGALGGEYAVGKHSIVFTPAFSLVAGNVYMAILDLTRVGGGLHRLEWSVAAAAVDPPQLEQIFPTTGELPANHLKFYLIFDQPMRQGDIFKFFSLWCVDKEEFVGRPFRHTELWSEDGKQLTLWFHPGRQKSGVNLNVELGAILEEGLEYELRVDDQWSSLEGAPLGETFRKRFRAIAKDYVQPNPADWQFELPHQHSSEPLLVMANEHLDYALLKRGLTVKQAGNEVLGRIEIMADERGMRFHRATGQWSDGRVELSVNPLIEDLAGNSPSRPFEVDINEVAEDNKKVSFSFELPSR